MTPIYTKHTDEQGQVRREAEAMGVGKANVRGSGKLSGPPETWDPDSVELVRLRNARKVVQALLEGLDGELSKLEESFANKGKSPPPG